METTEADWEKELREKEEKRKAMQKEDAACRELDGIIKRLRKEKEGWKRKKPRRNN